MQATLLDVSASLHALPADDAPPVGVITRGALLDLDPLADSANPWYTVHMPRGARAYLRGSTRILPYRTITLSADTDGYAEPDHRSPVVYRYAKQSNLLALGEQPDETGWIQVRDGQGDAAFLPPDTRLVNARTPRQREYANLADKSRERMLTGGIVFIVGIAITYGTYQTAIAHADAPGAQTYIIAWGPMAFGGVRLLLGLGGWLIYGGGDDPDDQEPLSDDGGNALEGENPVS